MLNLKGVHHVAIICSNYTLSRHFYTEILGLKILQEVFREERNSYKLDLAVNGEYQIELFSFPDPPERLSRPEGKGLRHIAVSIAELTKNGVLTEEIRIDEYSGKRFVFFNDPDGLPIELYES